jgi:MFS family permease
MSFLKSNIPLSSKTAFIALSALTFFFSAQVSLTIYIDSSFLKDAIEHTPSMAQMKLWSDPEHLVGAIYTLASLVTLLGLLYAPRVLRRVGNYRWTLSVIIIYTTMLFGLALFSSAWLIIPIFIFASAMTSVLYFNIDVFLERYSKDADTGSIRGLFLMIGSIAWLLPPLLAGRIIDTMGFSVVYLSGAILMLPALFIMMRYFSNFPDLSYDDAPLVMSKAQSRAHPDIHNILITNFFLHFFYAWMVIYTPLYLHNHVGFSYQQIGLMLTSALLAFVLFPYPAGRIADKWLGEKELLVFGFLLMAITSAIVPLLAGAGAVFSLWVLVLFFGRMGASIVETMTEAYFFKKIDGHDAGLIGYFRRSRPLAFIVAPVLASILLEFNIVAIEGLFTVLAGIMLFAIYFPLRLVDTK